MLDFFFRLMLGSHALILYDGVWFVVILTELRHRSTTVSH